jgi:hypothetical protein
MKSLMVETPFTSSEEPERSEGVSKDELKGSSP